MQQSNCRGAHTCARKDVAIFCEIGITLAKALVLLIVPNSFSSSTWSGLFSGK